MPDAMLEANKAIIRRLYTEAFTKGNLDAVDEIYAPDVEVHVPGLPQDPYGPARVKELIGLVRASFPGAMVTIEDLVAEYDKVVASVVWRAPPLGGGQGSSPYDPLIAWPRIDIYRLFEGKIVEHWADRNDTAALAQLGIT